MFVVSLGSSASLCFLLSLWGDAVPWLQHQKNHTNLFMQTHCKIVSMDDSTSTFKTMLFSVGTMLFFTFSFFINYLSFIINYTNKLQ